MLCYWLIALFPKAGLFSAILSAFVVQTYSMLSQAPDPGVTNKLMVTGFMALLSHTSPDTFNSTTSALFSPALFTPSAAARWINVLFFISLVLSLAAALFGILAKQWLREYMQWNLSIGSPRENVLVRQIRYEAWESWNVDAIIVSIPAILELAMILFLIGIVILLRVLDNVVYIAVTSIISLFLLTIAAFTILPIFSRYCPFKSPTAWACVNASWFVITTATATVACAYLNIREIFNVLHLRWEVAKRLRPTMTSRIQELLTSGRNWSTTRALDDNRWLNFGVIGFGVGWKSRLKSWRGRDLSTCIVTKLRAPG